MFLDVTNSAHHPQKAVTNLQEKKKYGQWVQCPLYKIWKHYHSSQISVSKVPYMEHVQELCDELIETNILVTISLCWYWVIWYILVLIVQNIVSFVCVGSVFLLQWYRCNQGLLCVLYWLLSLSCFFFHRGQLGFSKDVYLSHVSHM